MAEDEKADPMASEDELDARRSKRASISDQAAAVDGEVGEQQELDDMPPSLAGDKPLKLTGLARSGQPIESVAKVKSQAIPVDGVMDPDKRTQVLITVVPDSYRAKPMREDGDVKRWKYEQNLQPVRIVQANTSEALESVVLNVVEAGMDRAKVMAVVEEALAAALANSPAA